MRIFALVFLLVHASLLCAQDNQPIASLSKGTWDLGVWGGFGNGLGERTDHQFVAAGFRLGRILTEEHGSGWIRGNFELAADFMPVYNIYAGPKADFVIPCAPAPCTPETRTIGGAYYGASINPLVLKWNFTGRRKVVPFAEIAGGMLLTNRGFPDEAKTHFNFTPQGAFGLQVFTRERRAVSFSIRGIHISNASTSSPNPGINALLMFTVGYHWFK